MDSQIANYRAQGQRALRDALIQEHLSLVRHVLGRVVANLPAGVDRENLEAAGVLGLVEAAGNFDPQRKIPFPAFAGPRIRGAILDELRRNCPLPQRVLKQWALIRSASETLPPPVSVEAIARSTALTIDQVESCLADIRMSRTVGWEESQTPIQTANPMATHEEQLHRAERQQLVCSAIESLPDTMRIAITLYYRDDLRMKEVGEVLGLSESRVSRLIAAAELQLKATLRSALRQQTQE